MKKYILYIIILTTNIKIYAQPNYRLNIITENDNYLTIQNKVHNRLNYYCQENCKKCILNLSTKDSISIERKNNIEYILTPFYEALGNFREIKIIVSCSNKLIDSFYLTVISEPLVTFEENTHKEYFHNILKHKEKDDGTLDSLSFYVKFGLYADIPKWQKKMYLNLVKAQIVLFDSNKSIVDSFTIKSNYLNADERKRMRYFYETKKVKIIVLKDIILSSNDGLIYKPNYPYLLTSIPVFSME